MKNLALLLVILEFFLIGCRPGAVTAPTRPAAVSKSAIWVGGTDGGAWYDCSFIAEEPYNLCAIYSDDGVLWIKAKFKLRSLDRPAKKEEFRNPWVDHIPDATEIHLDGGKTLVAVQVLYLAGH